MKNMHVYGRLMVTRIGDTPQPFESITSSPAALRKRAREYADATPAGGWPVAIQEWEYYRSCDKNHTNTCWLCDSPGGDQVREFGEAALVSGRGEPQSVVVRQELLQRP